MFTKGNIVTCDGEGDDKFYIIEIFGAGTTQSAELLNLTIGERHMGLESVSKLHSVEGYPNDFVNDTITDLEIRLFNIKMWTGR
ncbi:MAG: hypothetical protein HC836_10540 [Richelia sp. RM2_1_2]|nr:hypothetical protein [Richelia sp. RM2_1_2]